MNSSRSQADRVASILQSLGEAYLLREQYAEAAAKFAQLLQAGQATPAIHRSFALALLGMNQAHEPARQAYQHVLQLFPNDRELLLKICRALLMHNARDPLALHVYKQTLKLNPPANRETLQALAQHFLKNEQPEPAFETLKRIALQENGEVSRTLMQIMHLGWRLEKYAETRSVLEYLAGRNESAMGPRRLLALDAAYALHRTASAQDATPRYWQTIVHALSVYGRLEYMGTLREFSALRLALACIHSLRVPKSAREAEGEAADDSSFLHELSQRLPALAAPTPSATAPPQALVLKISNIEYLLATNGEAMAWALAAKFLDFAGKYLAKAALASCFRMRDGLLAFGDSLNLLTLGAIDLLHKIDRYDATAKPATRIWVEAVAHARTESGGSAWRMLYETLHILESQNAAAGAPEKNRSILRVTRAVFEKQHLGETLPAKYVGLHRAEVPFFQTEVCEAIWRNPLEYVQEKTPYLFGKFLVTEKLRGSRAAGTYRARDRELERTLILKALSPHNSYRLTQEAALRERVTRALRHFGKLALPGLALIFDMGMQEEIFFFVREYIEGKSLEHLQNSRRRLSWPEGLALGARLCRILHAAHRTGVCHGNLKPGNLWLSASGEVKVSDFHVPLFVDHPDPDNLLNLASWQYSAPERRQGQPLRPTCDVYSLGAIIMEMLTGVPPELEEGEAGVLRETGVTGPPLPPFLTDILNRACNREAQDRFQTLADFEQALRGALDLMRQDQEVVFDEITRLARDRQLLETGSRK